MYLELRPGGVCLNNLGEIYWSYLVSKTRDASGTDSGIWLSSAHTGVGGAVEYGGLIWSELLRNMGFSGT